MSGLDVVMSHANSNQKNARPAHVKIAAGYRVGMLTVEEPTEERKKRIYRMAVSV